MADFNWRTLNIDALDPESSYNFDLTTLTPAVQPVSTEDVQTLSGQIKQLMRAGQAEEALKGALENPPYGADEQGKVRQARAHQYHSTEKTECGLQHSERTIAKRFFGLTECPPQHSHRDLAVNTAIGNDAHPAAHLPVRRWFGGLRYSYEVPLQGNGPEPAFNRCYSGQRSCAAAGVHTGCWEEFWWCGGRRTGYECAAELA
jgi:hypothetical protein